MKGWYQWAVWGSLIFLLIILPFVFWGDGIEAWVAGFLVHSSLNYAITALILGMLLAVDILVPVPSSLISTAAGYILGWGGGTLTSLLGMSLSCLVGYWLGLRPGRALTGRLIGIKKLRTLEMMQNRYGDWVIIISRPVPVLAEASTLFAGISRMAFGRYFTLTSLANLGISLVYAFVGACSYQANSFLLAFAGAVILPVVTMTLISKVNPGA